MLPGKSTCRVQPGRRPEEEPGREYKSSGVYQRPIRRAAAGLRCAAPAAYRSSMSSTEQVPEAGALYKTRRAGRLANGRLHYARPGGQDTEKLHVRCPKNVRPGSALKKLL